jgi:hypothetical protein
MLKLEFTGSQEQVSMDIPEEGTRIRDISPFTVDSAEGPLLPVSPVIDPFATHLLS